MIPCFDFPGLMDAGGDPMDAALDWWLRRAGHSRGTRSKTLRTGFAGAR